jgi:hypothetical protein
MADYLIERIVWPQDRNPERKRIVPLAVYLNTNIEEVEIRLLQEYGGIIGEFNEEDKGIIEDYGGETGCVRELKPWQAKKYADWIERMKEYIFKDICGD